MSRYTRLASAFTLAHETGIPPWYYQQLNRDGFLTAYKLPGRNSQVWWDRDHAAAAVERHPYTGQEWTTERE